MNIRRVVTGHRNGRAVVLSDAPARAYALGPGFTLFDIWRTLETPALIAAEERDPTDVPLDFNIDKSGVRLRIVDMPPASKDAAPHMHRTESVDYAMVLSGECVMILEEGEVTLRTGDIVVQRGTNHAWVNRGDVPCRMAFVMIGGRFAPDIEALQAAFSPEDFKAVLTTGR